MTDPLGGQGATDPAGAQGGATGGNGAASGGSAGDSGAGTGASGETGTGSGQSATVSVTEFEALKARMQAADQRASKAENDLKQIRDKDMPELAKAQRDLVESQKLVETLTKATNDLRIENAFLTDNTINWQNPGTALRLLDRTKVTVDDAGNVAGMKAACEALSKSDAYLVKPAEGTNDGAGAGALPPGTPPANGGVGGTGRPDTKDLKRRFPALGQRLG